MAADAEEHDEDPDSIASLSEEARFKIREHELSPRLERQIRTIRDHRQAEPITASWWAKLAFVTAIILAAAGIVVGLFSLGGNGVGPPGPFFTTASLLMFAIAGLLLFVAIAVAIAGNNSRHHEWRAEHHALRKEFTDSSYDEFQKAHDRKTVKLRSGFIIPKASGPSLPSQRGDGRRFNADVDMSYFETTSRR